MDLPTLEDIQQARARIAPFVHRTPVQRNQGLSDRFGTNVYLKLELFQKTGAFKVRGAFNRMLLLSEAERARGVVATSGGNHAQAVAYAARMLGIRARILMPSNTPHNYLEATRSYGAEVELTPTIADAFARAEQYRAEGWVYVHPFDDRWVMAGQGTLGLELLEEVPQMTDVFISIGGGGLMTGVATAIKTLCPQVRIWGVETEGADSMAQALRAGHVVELPAITSIAKTLGAPAVSERALEAARRYLESVTVVRDAEAVEAMRWLLERAKVLTEPAASCTLAALERLRDRFGPGDHVVLILCGGNVALDDLCRYVHRFLSLPANAVA
jgi:threonine dehydratase